MFTKSKCVYEKEVDSKRELSGQLLNDCINALNFVIAIRRDITSTEFMSSITVSLLQNTLLSQYFIFRLINSNSEIRFNLLLNYMYMKN